MNKRLYLVLFFTRVVAAMMSVTLNSCSVGMAMSGKKTPELGSFKVGSTRQEVELQLGSPIKSVTLENKKRLDVYEYEVGNDPSVGRAIGHGVLDVLTLGWWELGGTPVEGFIGEKHNLTLTYDENDRVVAINSSVPQTATGSQKPEMVVKKENGQAEGPKATTLQKLKELQEMKEAGLVSAEEYEIRRAKILDDFY